MKQMRILALLSMLFVILIGCQPAQQRAGNQSSSSHELTITIFGGSWGDAIKEHIIKPFEKEHGVKVNVVEGTSTVTFSKLKQERNAPTIDIALMDSGISELAYQEGFVDEIDVSKLSNAKDLVPLGFQKSGEKTYGVVLGYWGLGIAYDPKKVKNPPTSWLDLWKKEYENKVTIPTPETTSGLPLLLKLAELNGGGANDIGKGFEKVKSLKTVAYFNGSGAASNLFQSGEVIIGAHYGGPVWAMKDEGASIEFVIPKEGVLGAGSYWHLVKGSSNKELAMKFLDQAISVEAQKGIAEQLYLAPVNKKVKLSEKAATRMPYKKGGSIEEMDFPDYELINQHREEWNDRWNKEIGKQ